MTEKQKFVERLFNEHYDSLLRMAKTTVRNKSDAEDLVQETILKAIEAWETLRNHPKPAAWLSITLRNCEKNFNRLCENRLTVPLDGFGEILVAKAAEQPLSHFLPAKLPEKDKEILIWHYEQGRNYKEISAQLGITEKACRVRVCRIIKRCKKLM